MAEKWWENAVIYQIYPKSFKDSNDDGYGDLAGIISKLDYLADLGIQAIWLNPIFESPQIDHGYDVSNYFKIDPVFGNLEMVDRLIEEAHLRNIKVIFDFVLNHTSSDHPWFKEAVKGRNNFYRNYYLWSDGGENQQVPNNWASFFGGSVWQKEPDGDQYYFHLFAKEMPDLNWKNPQVRKAMLQIADHWIKRGVDGLRLDAFIHLAKADFSLQMEPKEGQKTNGPLIAEKYYSNLPQVHDYMHEFAAKIKENYPDVFIVGEAASATAELAQAYTDPDHMECDSVITFRYFSEDETGKDRNLAFDKQPAKLNWMEFKNIMDDWQDKLGRDRYPILYWNNHDMARMVSRFGNEANYRAQSQKMLATMMYLQKGIPVIYFGEEIGMKNLVIPSIEKYADFSAEDFYRQAINLGYPSEKVMAMLNATTKDASRGVMQWDREINAGFSKRVPWSGVNQEEVYNVMDQLKDPQSIWYYYQELFRIKRTDLFQKGKFERVASQSEIYSYSRSYQQEIGLVVCNTSDTLQTFSARTDLTVWKCLLKNEDVKVKNNQMVLSAYGAAVLKLKGIEK